MYSTCLHCHTGLGKNESIETFPVGKRLAFDAAKGRLWVVCPSCGRWNLAPIEERWEAVEDCERQFRVARQKVSRGEIGLAHLRSGLHLVRIGAPVPAEMAAWRYGRVLRKRWLTRGLPLTVVGVGAAGFQFFPAYSPGAMAPLTVGVTVFFGLALRHAFRVRGRVALPDGHVAKLRLAHPGKAILDVSDPVGLRLHFEDGQHKASLGGVVATHTLRGLLTLANYGGAREKELSSALELLDTARGPRHYIEGLGRAAERSGARDLLDFPADIRCALEMALHDDTERRAMDGELADLLAEWRRAEEIASIADNMFLGDSSPRGSGTPAGRRS